MTTAEALARGRECFARRAWADAFAELSAAAGVGRHRVTRLFRAAYGLLDERARRRFLADAGREAAAAMLPSVAQYKSKVGRLVTYFRGLGVREFGTWNEANHASQPTYRSPTRAAQFFREMYRMVKGRCSSCAIAPMSNR